LLKGEINMENKKKNSENIKDIIDFINEK